MTTLDITRFNIKDDSVTVDMKYNDHSYKAIKYVFNNIADLHYLFGFMIKSNSLDLIGILFDSYGSVIVPNHKVDCFDKLLHNELMILVHDWSKIQKILKGFNNEEKPSNPSDKT